MELTREALNVGEIIYGGTIESVSDGDLIVPDVKPDIDRVLQVDASACISTKEISDGKLNVAGRVDITVIYLPDTEEDGIQKLNTSFDFYNKLERTEIDNDCVAIVEADVKKAEFHLINSRKISLKAVTEIDCEIISKKELELVTDADESAERRYDKMVADTLLGIRDFDFIIKERVEVPSGKASIKELLKVNYKVSDKECKAITEKVIVKGTLNVSALYKNSSNGIECAEAEIPFTEVFDYPDIDEDAKCTLNYRICDSAFEVSEDDDGDDRIINIDLIVCAEIKAEKRAERDIICDCYMPGQKTNLTYKNFELIKNHSTPSCQNALRDVVVIDKALPQIKNVYSVITKTFITDAHTEKEKLAVEGKIEVCILYISDDDSMPVYSFKKDIPFSYLLDSVDTKEGMPCECVAEVSHISYHLNVSNEVELRCILNINGRVYEKKELQLIEDAENEEISAKDKKGIVIYFVQAGDTLWNIAKAYSVPINAIAEFNKLENPNNLEVGQRLVIPASK